MPKKNGKEPKGSRKGFKTKITSNGFERTVTVSPRKKKTTTKRKKK